MDVSFRFLALPLEAFAPLLDLEEADLQALGARRVTVEGKPGVPCRVSLVDAEVGETAILLPYQHHDVASPYRASGPIFVRENARQATPAAGDVPAFLRHRLLSLRAYDDAAIMLDAEVVEGKDLEAAIARLFSQPEVSYLHVHNARPGCYNCKVVRAPLA
jgi:hypothetical protein